MRHYSWGLLFLSLIFIIICFGCSSNKDSSPVAPTGDGFPMADVSDKGHAIMTSGTFEIDIENMVVRDVTDRVGALHYNITGILGGNFRYFVTAINPPYLTLRLEITNPTSLQVWDVRIIYVDLYEKEIVNPDGFTNFYDPAGGPDFNPFHYFAKEYPNQAFPVGPGAKDDEILELLWTPGAPAFVTYIIECSLFDNAQEPYKISNFQADGDMTPEGGGMIVACDVNDWQDDVSSVTLLANEFYGEDVPMYSFRGTNTYVGSLVNLLNAGPGDHIIWIKAESPNPNDIHLYMPFVVSVPDVTDDAPRFDYLPYSTRERISKGIPTYLNGSAINPEGGNLNYLWEQISPISPTGQFTGTGGSSIAAAKWEPPQVNEDTEYLFRIVASETTGPLASRAVVMVLNEAPLPPEITFGPLIVPSPVDENDFGQFGVDAEDPNAPDDEMPLHYLWEQLAPGSPTGEWVGTSMGEGKYPVWTAPEVGADTTFTFQITVTKDWVTPPLETTETLEFDVINTN